MTGEDYVSFETAKLLKEKGFNEPCRFIYDAGYFCSIASTDCRWNEGYGELVEELSNSEFSGIDNRISAPTLQMAMKWLREVHKLYCDIRVGDGDFVIDIISLKDGEFGCEVVEPESCVYLTYEEACEAAIKYCLENLI